MPSTYTLNNGIELIGTGEQSGTWGDTTNTNLGLLDAALDGQVTVALASAGSSGSPNSLPITDGTASNGRNRMVVFSDSGDLGATAYVQLTPNDAEKIIYIRNSLSGSRSVILFQGTYNASNDYEVPAGTTAVVYFDGAGAGAVAANVFNNAYFDGLRLGSVSVTAILDEDNMASDSAAALATQQSIKAYVDSQVGTVDTLAEILAIGNTTGATDIAVDSAQKVQFRDAAIYINSSVDGQLDIVADTEIQIAATTVDVNGALDVSGTALVTGVLTTTAATVFNGGFASNADSTLGTDKKVQFRDSAIYINSSADGQLDLVADTEIQIAATTIDVNGTLAFDSLKGTGATTVTNILDEDNMASDSAAALATQQSIKAYVDSQVGTVDTLAEILAIGNTTGATDIAVDSAQKVQFRDAAIYINSSVDGQLDIVADTEIQIAATTIDVNGALDVSGTALVTGVLTTTAATVSNGGGQFNGAINVGVDDTGYDVKFFGATTGKSLLWDESADSLIVTGTTTLVGTTNLDAVDIDGATQIDATVTVGVDDTGYDVKFFGATAGAYMLWDESADDLILGGAAGLSVNSTALVTGVLTTTAATVHTGGITMPDNAKAIFGDSSDLEIYHNGTNSIISDEGAGALVVQSNGSGIYLNNGVSENMLTAVIDGAVTLYHDNAAKIATTATGIDVTGTVVADGLRLDGTACIGLNVAPSEFGGGVATITLKGTTSAKSGAIKFIDDNDTSVASIFAQNDITYGLSIGTLGGTGDFIRFHTGALGTERMRIDSIGAVTMPYQPAFLARPTGTQADIPASTTVTVVFGTEVFDQNADFASNTFTAPVTGKYQFSYSLYLTNIDTAAAYYEIELQTSNRSYSFVIDPNFVSDLNYLTITQSVLADMDASDAAYVTIRQQLGTAQTDISTILIFQRLPSSITNRVK
jgi:hypothetical protein